MRLPTSGRWRRTGTGASAALSAVLLLALTAGCGAHDGSAAEPVPMPSVSTTSQAVTEAHLVHLWPLTVDHGEVACTEKQYAIFHAPDGTEYALNEAARRHGYADIEPLRRRSGNGALVSLGALRSTALGLCGNA
jgi:hypothetical protein